MQVQIIATKGCNHRPILEKELQNTDTEYEVIYIDDHPDLAEKYHIRNSPNLLINGEVVFRPGHGKSLPSADELEKLLLDYELGNR